MKTYLIFLCLIISSGIANATIQNKADPDKPPIIFVNQYSDNWIESYPDTSWGANKNYNSDNNSYQGNGHFFFHYGVGYGWLDTDYQWADTNQAGTYTSTGYDAGGYSLDESGIGYEDPYNFYARNPDPYSTPSLSWTDGGGRLSHYYANINYNWDYPQYNEHDNYTRTAKTFLQLKTGGKVGANRQNLFAISASAIEYGQTPSPPGWGNIPDLWSDTPATNIESTRIRVLGKNLGNDGKLYTVLPDNATLDLGASAPGMHYSMNVSATKYKLRILANDYTLADNRVRPGAKHVIGEKINLSPIFIPALPEQPQETVKWTMAGQFINAFTVWDNLGNQLENREDLYDSAFGLTGFRVDADRLQWINAFAWWQTGSPNGYESETINLAMNLTFANGQQAVITANGLLGMHQPTVSWAGYVAGIVDGELVIGDGPSGLYKVGLLDDHNGRGIAVEANSASLVPGRFGITQLVIRNSSAESWSEWGLDNSMPYNGSGASSYSFSSASPFGSASDTLTDGPYVSGIGGAYCADQFEQFFMFRPNTSGSIWANLGISYWSWSGAIIWSTSDPQGWVWVGTPQFYDSQTITPSSNHPEWKVTHYH